MVAERIQKVKGKEKAYCVYIPESYMKHCGWEAGEVVALYPNAEGTKIELVSMDPEKHKGKKDSNECEVCGFSSFY